MSDLLLAAMFRGRIRGAQRLAILLRRGELLPSVMTKTIEGLSFLADPTSVIDLAVLADGSYEPHVLRSLIDVIPQGGVLWDVGANTGIHSIAVKHHRPDVTVVAIEANPLTFARLYANVEGAGVDVTLRSVALAGQAGYLPLSVVRKGNTGLTSLRPWSDIQYDDTIVVWCDTGDNLVACGVPSPDVVKVDVEGFESEVLDGMGDLLASLAAVVIEARPEVAARLASTGYSVSKLDEAGNYLAVRCQ